ncbi:MAG: CTP synthase [Christensenellales bacterium]|jgi:CTP synthase
MSTKFVFITGGVVSSLGKGITAAALGRLLKNRGLSVSINKLDPYINVDPGTMNPYQHGEVFVTDDGAETDLDIGHYERFINEPLARENNTTTGQIYLSVMEKERKGMYNGATVQVIPHITNEIMSRIINIANKVRPDVLITEIGGTVGDIESQPYLEAIRQIKWTVGPENCAYIHVTLMPYIGTAGELKSKPTQHSVRELLGLGIQPDILVCRSDRPLGEDVRTKIGLFCNIDQENVIENLDAAALYEVPLLLEEKGLGRAVCKKLCLDLPAPDMREWEKIVHNQLNPLTSCTIAIVGKYVELHDAYLSIAESLIHGGIYNRSDVTIKWVQAEDVNASSVAELLEGVDGVIVPGGFGSRGLEGKISAVKYVRENKIPFLGICLGMQMAVVEFARNVIGLNRAHTTEVDTATPYPVIDIMPDQRGLDRLGGTMRLGKYTCDLKEGTLARAAYGKETIYERHRHRYEFNNKYVEAFEEAGMVFSGWNPDGKLAEIIELPSHPFYIACQFHPEFKSRPDNAHPLFKELIAAAAKHREKR